MKCGDIVLAGHQAFKITGIYLGGVGTQNLVGLTSMTQTAGSAHGNTITEMLVPEDLVLCAGVYRRVD